MPAADLTVEQCQALMRLSINSKRIDAALDAKDRRWFLELCRLRGHQASTVLDSAAGGEESALSFWGVRPPPPPPCGSAPARSAPEHIVTNRIVTNQGRTDDRSITILVKER